MATHLTHRGRITWVWTTRPSRPTAPDARDRTSRHRWPSYDPARFYDELVGPDGAPRPAAEALWATSPSSGPRRWPSARTAADREIRAIGVTFTVYEGATGVDRRGPSTSSPGSSLATSGSSSSPAWSSG